MRILLGATKYEYSSATGARQLTIRKNAQRKFTNTDDEEMEVEIPTGDGLTVAGKNHFPTTKPSTYKWINMTTGERGTQASLPTLAVGATAVIRFFWEEAVSSTANVGATQLVISPEQFPGALTMIMMGLHCGVKQINLVNCWNVLFAR